ncbi:MAG: O-antigen ligase family protein [Candidatus Velthaea sp.]
MRPAWAAFRVSAMRVPLALLAATVAAEVVSAMHARYLGPLVREIFKTLEYGAVFAVIALAFASDPDERPIWRAINLTVLAVCITALAQYVVGANAGIFVDGRSIPRIAGLLEGPNQLSGYLGIALPLLVARNLVHRDSRLVALIALTGTTDLLTFSRAGIVAAVIGCGIVFALMRPPRHVGIRFGSVAVIVAATAVALAVRVGFSGDYFSLNPVPQPADHLGNRAILWHAAIAMWHSSPLVGVGAGNFEDRLADFGVPGVHTHANSVYLQGLAEGGNVRLDCLHAGAHGHPPAVRRGRARGDRRLRRASDFRRSVVLPEGRRHVVDRACHRLR